MPHLHLAPAPSSPLPARIGGQDWVSRRGFESSKARPSWGPTAKGAGSAQARQVRGCAYLEVPHLVLRDLCPEVRSASGTLNSPNYPACKPLPWESAWLLSPPTLGTEVRRTLDLSQPRAELDTQATQTSIPRFGLGCLSRPLHPPSLLNLFSFICFGLLGYSSNCS